MSGERKRRRNLSTQEVPADVERKRRYKVTYGTLRWAWKISQTLVYFWLLRESTVIKATYR